MSDLLPPNATALERAAAVALTQLAEIPVPLRTLWNPDTCPVDLLPYLAWTFSVDRWDSTWSESTKREVIRGSFFVHKRKGTISALRRVVEPLGYLLRVVEWWQTEPNGPAGTFRLDIGVLSTGISDDTYIELERLIDDAKPVSRHLTGLAINLESRGNLHIGAASYSGDAMTVYPFAPGPIEVGGSLRAGFGQHIIDTVSVFNG
jgi:phage tail P2-like protein